MIDSVQSFFDSLMQETGLAIPNIIAAVLVLVLGFIIAGAIKRFILYLFKKASFDEKVGSKFGLDFRIDKFVASIIYYILIIYALLMVLDYMGLEGVLIPLSDMLDKVLLYLPNIFAAAIIIYAGYAIANLCSQAIAFFSGQILKITEKAGVKSSINIEAIIKQLVFLLVFVPIIIVALDTLNMKVISEPATAMLDELLAAIPNILGAVVILLVFFIGGRFVVDAIVELMKNVNLDGLSKKMYLNKVLGEDKSLAKLMGNLIYFFIIFAGVISAVEKLEMSVLSEALDGLLVLSGNIFLGLVILAIGNALAQFAYKTVSSSDNGKWVANIARFAVWGLFISIALNTMGLGEDVVNLAFALTLGAASVAFALAFGLGGREAAGKFLDNLINKKKSK
ncbi:mechanosensitive ion channel [Marivirga sp.]|uniref:mechanosensitive ion channel n=1 Tax=Marivirga sp. TaxID=2018662 RepID=UPI003DA7234D